MAIEDSVTRAIYGLKDKPEEAKGILLGVKPAISAGSLVWALGDPLLRAGSQEVLVIYGASDDTVKPLVASLGNPLYRGSCSLRS